MQWGRRAAKSELAHSLWSPNCHSLKTQVHFHHLFARPESESISWHGWSCGQACLEALTRWNRCRQWDQNWHRQVFSRLTGVWLGILRGEDEGREHHITPGVEPRSSTQYFGSSWTVHDDTSEHVYFWHACSWSSWIVQGELLTLE